MGNAQSFLVENAFGKFYCENSDKEMFHRVDGPAIIDNYGAREWWFKGKRHREDGPAFISHTEEVWYVNGLVHRIDGPAIICSIGGHCEKSYYLFGRYYEKTEWEVYSKALWKIEAFRLKRKYFQDYTQFILDI